MALFVAFLGAWLDLEHSRADLYQRLRFEDYSLTLAHSQGAEAAVRSLPGARLRLAARGDASWPGGRLPALVLGTSVGRRPVVNDLDVTAGRYLEGPGECLVEARFARRHGLAPGSVVTLAHRPLRVVGLARSPEFLYYTDDRRHPLSRLEALAVLWASDADVESLGLPSLATVHGTGPPPSEELAAWEPRLSLRERHPSHSLLARDRRAFATVALLFPAVLLSLGAGLLIVSTWHLLEGSRDELLVLRALGFPARAGEAPYRRLGLLLGTAATLGGWVLGSLVGRVVSAFYAAALGIDFQAGWHPELLAAAGLLTVPVSWGAAALACRLVTRPAPPWPALVFARIRSLRWRLATRNLARTPVRTLLAALGVASGVAATVMVLAFFASQRQAVELFFGEQRRYDLEVHLRDTMPASAIPRIDGAAEVTPVLSRTVTVADGPEAMVWGVPAGGLLTLLSPTLAPVQPEAGEWLPGSLHPGQGTVEVRYAGGARARKRLGAPVLEILAGPYWASLADLQREAVRHGLPSEAVDCLLVRVEPGRERAVAERLQRQPWVETVLDMGQIHAALDDLLRMLDAYKAAMLALAFLVASAVQAGALSLTLSERWTEVRLLRVQGLPFAPLLRAEMALVWLLGLGLGLPLGMALGTALVKAYQNDVVSLRLAFDPLSLAGAALLAGGQVAFVTRLGERHLGRLPLC